MDQNLKKLIDQVKTTRSRQNNYFKCKTKASLILALEEEKRLDNLVIFLEENDQDKNQGSDLGD